MLNNFKDRAEDILPGATFGNFDPDVIIREGYGAHVWDSDGTEYIDYLIGSGPMILGHVEPEVTEAVQEQLKKGSTFFATNERGIELAEEIGRAVMCAEQVRFVSTGGEANMFAMRIARAFTGQNKLIKFEGGFHGMSAEAQMSLAPKSLANFPNPEPDSAGIPHSVREEILIAPYNDIDFTRSLISEYNGQIAGIIVEPVQRIIPPIKGFLEALREECTKHNIVLIFDEVVTGFRLSYGGAQEYFGVIPDICTLGKIIGGGFPLAAIGGKKEIMNHFNENSVNQDQFLMQHGTLSGNPIAAAAGLKTLEILRREGQYEKLRYKGQKLMHSLKSHLSKTGHDHKIIGNPVLFDIVFTKKSVENYRDILQSDTDKIIQFNKLLRNQNILKTIGKFYISLALTDDDISQTIQAIEYSSENLST